MERKISVVQTDFGLKGPSFLLANNENKKISKCLVPFARIPKGEKDKVIELMGIAKLNSDRVPPYCITISPEFIVELGTKYSDAYGSSHQNILLNDSLVMEVKETLSIDQLKEIRNLFMQPISRSSN